MLLNAIPGSSEMDFDNCQRFPTSSAPIAEAAADSCPAALLTSKLLCPVTNTYMQIITPLFGLSLTVFLMGKLSIAMVATTLYVYSAELYPTTHRHSLFAFSSMIGRIGSILAPLTPVLGLSVWEHLPFILFGDIALISVALVLVAPETLGAKLADTMEDAARLGRKTPISTINHKNRVNFSEL